MNAGSRQRRALSNASPQKSINGQGTKAGCGRRHRLRSGRAETPSEVAHFPLELCFFQGYHLALMLHTAVPMLQT